MFGIVINKDGYKVEFVVLDKDKTPQFYELKEDEQIIEKDWAIANSMNKPKWNFEKEIWEETEPKEVENEVVDKTKICTTQQLQEKVANLEDTLIAISNTLV